MARKGCRVALRAARACGQRGRGRLCAQRIDGQRVQVQRRDCLPGRAAPLSAALHTAACATALHAPLRGAAGQRRGALLAARCGQQRGHWSCTGGARAQRSAAPRSFAPCNTPCAECPRPHARARACRMTPGPRGARLAAQRGQQRGRPGGRRRAARPPADRGRPAGAPRVARPPRRARSAAGRSRRPRRARPGPPPRSRSRCGSPPARPAAPRRRACARPASAGLLAGARSDGAGPCCASRPGGSNCLRMAALWLDECVGVHARRRAGARRLAMRKQRAGRPPRPTRPRSWCSCARPKRSAPSTSITLASRTSTPTCPGGA